MNLIVAVSENWGIGKDNNLLFCIREDLMRFKEITLNKVVVMGHSTFKSLPKNRRPLKDRINIVLSRDTDLTIPGATVCYSLGHLYETLKAYDTDDIYIIGGEAVYTQLLNDCTRAYITKVQAVPQADTFFPNIEKLPNWQLVEESETMFFEGLAFSYCLYTNVKGSKALD